MTSRTQEIKHMHTHLCTKHLRYIAAKGPIWIQNPECFTTDGAQMWAIVTIVKTIIRSASLPSGRITCSEFKPVCCEVSTWRQNTMSRLFFPSFVTRGNPASILLFQQQETEVYNLNLLSAASYKHRRVILGTGVHQLILFLASTQDLILCCLWSLSPLIRQTTRALMKSCK